MNTLGIAALFVAIAVANAGYVSYSAPLAYTRTVPLVHSVVPVAYTKPIVETPLVSLKSAQVGLKFAAPAGSGLEGQWIPDINEKFYDDGSYKSYHYDH